MQIWQAARQQNLGNHAALWLIYCTVLCRTVLLKLSVVFAMDNSLGMHWSCNKFALL